MNPHTFPRSSPISLCQMDDEYLSTAAYQVSCRIHENFQVSNPNTSANMSKKRKFLSETAGNWGGFPSPSKHRCRDPALASELDNREIIQCGLAGRSISEVMSGDAEVGSAQDSNSYGGDSCSTCNETKLDLDDGKNSLDEGSTSWSVSARGRMRNVCCDLDGGMGSKVARESCYSWKDDDGGCLDDAEEIGKRSDQLESVHCKDEFEEFPYSNGLDPAVYFLSTESWDTDQEAQTGTRKPTIDQEFEQYFSMLML